ncbi:MAG: hypothetical protein FWC41_08790, partial [Firmicutes bacterium]|nr:hypothetical protein [Bacillota bacterium]
DIGLRKKVTELVGETDLSFLDSVKVYVTDEKDALALMDKTHGGEQEGIGVIPWEAYQRDVSLVKRGKTAKYPYAFNVASVLEIKKEKDFLIPYTDLDRLFGAKIFRDIFDIVDLTSTYKKNVVTAQMELLEYKKEKSFKSFSREFNVINTKDTTNPILRFCDWYAERKKGKNEFTVSAKDVTIFEDESFDDSLFEIKINSKNAGKVNYNQNEIYFEYFTPQGKPVKNVDNKHVGSWKVKINYKGVSIEKNVFVQQLQEPDVVFRDEVITVFLGSSVSLSNVVIRALNSHKQDMKSTLKCVPLDDAIIEQGTFTTENPEGVYTISFQFDDLGKQVAISKKIVVQKDVQPLSGKKLAEKLLVFPNSININISLFVNSMINEINALNLDNYPCLITSSIRSLIELALTALSDSNKLTFEKSGLDQRLLELQAFFMDQKNATEICKKQSFCSFKETENFFNQLDTKSLVATLHLGAHRSHEKIDLVDLKEKCQKSISPLIVYIHALMNT